MLKNIPFLLILIIIGGCTENKTLKAELNVNQIIPKGEWISDSDSLSGISIRGDKIAFFKNMQFNSEDIYQYKIVDSVAYENQTKKIVSTYLVTFYYVDTIRYKIKMRTKSTIDLLLNKNKKETFTLKKG